MIKFLVDWEGNEMTKYLGRETPLMKLLKQKDIDGFTLPQFQEILNKIIKPYIVKRGEGYCTILIPLSEYDKFADRIYEEIEKTWKR